MPAPPPDPPATALTTAARVVVAGVAVDPVTLEQAVEHVEARLAAPRGGAPALVVTANVDQSLHVRADPELAAAYDAADLVLADGAPVVGLARLLGAPLPGRVCGSDLLPALCAHAALLGWSTAVVGGAAGVAEQAAGQLQQRHPGLRVVLTSSPPWGFERDAQATQTLLAQVESARPDLLFLCVGAPKAELFAARAGERLAVGVVACVGAAVDYEAGTARRAPRWLQRAGLEWLWRLASDPRRLASRYLVRGPRYLAAAYDALRSPHPVLVPRVVVLPDAEVAPARAPRRAAGAPT